MPTASEIWRAQTGLSARQQVIDCTACDLHARCSLPVPYSGQPKATVAVVIDTPTITDDKAGKLYMPTTVKTVLKDAKLDLTKVALVPAVACWPSDDDLDWPHVEKCAPNRAAQLDDINPTHVLLLGEVPLRAFRPDLTIKTARGHGWTAGDRVWFATYGPATADASDRAAQTMLEDVEQFVKLVAGAPVDNERCVSCPKWAVWWTEDGLGWCEDHDTAGFHDRAELIARDLAGARARSQVG